MEVVNICSATVNNADLGVKYGLNAMKPLAHQTRQATVQNSSGVSGI